MKKIKIPVFHHHLHIILSIRPKKTKPIMGITNRCSDGKYIPFLDYDNHRKNDVINELKHLQKKYQLSNIYVFETSQHSYHAISLDKISLKTYLELLAESNSDYNFKKVPLKHGLKTWTLRFTKKDGKSPKLISCLSRGSKKQKSNPHRIFLTHYYGIRIKKNKYFDNNHSITTDTYMI